MSLAVTTARDILLAAFEDMVVRMDEETLEASDAQTGVRYINWIMADLSVNGVDLGFTKISDISDPITIAEGLMMSLSSILAFKLWPKYRTIPRTTEVSFNAKEGYDLMYKAGITIAATEYPGTLPRGSGNDYPSRNNYKYYQDLESTILDEQNGSISLEDDTE